MQVKTITLEEEKAPDVGEKVSKKATRALGLDALRGLAIIGMVFSGVFPHEEPWPAWMFHAQVGPPGFSYTPEVPGITWVDLVFPFFLFTMGAAFPLALRKKAGGRKRTIFVDIIKRGALLVFFALALRHTNPGFLKGDLWINYLTGILSFIGFFLVFTRFNTQSRTRIYTLRTIGFGVIFLMVSLHSIFTPLDFSPYRSDIIILVLANMAVFGTVIWLLTTGNLMLRLGVLCFFGAFWLTRDYEGSFSEAIFSFHSGLSWFYQFAFLKYLNIVIPGTILGDMLVRKGNEKYSEHFLPDKIVLVFIALGLVLVNLYGLFTREIMFTFVADAILCLAGARVVSQFSSGKEVLLKKLFHWGIFWLFLGLAFEPMDGGIKKDPSSFSFWFVTSGLAFFTYIVCDLLITYKPKSIIWKNIVYAGQNPMVAYVAGSYVILPFMYFLQITEVFSFLRETNVYLGIIKAVVVTLAVVWLTSFTTGRKWFWKT